MNRTVVIIRKAQERRNKPDTRVETVNVPRARYLKLLVAARAAKNFAESVSHECCPAPDRCWICDITVAIKDLEDDWEVI